MAQATESRRKIVRMAAVVALAVSILALPAWTQGHAARSAATSLPSQGQSASAVLTLTPGLASTAAGTGISGYSGDGGQAVAAQFNFPMGLARDSQGNVFVADFANSVVRKLSADGTVSTVAGTGSQGYSGDGGPATSAQLAFPTAVAIDSNGNLLIADYFNRCIRKVDAKGSISTLATASGFFIRGVAADASGNVYFSGYYEGVWKVDAEGVITKIVGNGTPGFSGDGGLATNAQTSGVAGMTFDSAGNLYFAEVLNSDVRKVDTNGIITTFAGNQQFGYDGDNGPATSAKMNGPTDVRFDAAGDLYIADSSNNRIRKVNVAGTISSIVGDGNYGYAGDGRLASMAQFAGPTALVLDGRGNLLISDTGNSVLRLINVETTTLDFGTVMVGQTRGPIVVTVSNIGNAGLTLSSIAASAGFAAPTTCSITSPLAPGAECTLGASFIPSASGTITGTVTLTDNAAGNPHLVNLKGVGAQTPTELVVLGQFAIIQLGGNLGVVTVDAMDAQGHLLTDFTGTVTLQIQGPAGFTPYIGQAQASGGITTFDLSALILNVAGEYTLSVTSPGLPSSGTSFTVAGNPDFTTAMSRSSLTVGSSSTGSLNVNVTPSNGFSGTIALSCSGLPANSKCSFSPLSLRADGSNAQLTSVLTISTGVTNTSALPPAQGQLFLAASSIFGTGILGLVFAPGLKRRSSPTRRFTPIQLIVVVLILCGGLVGCGSLGGKVISTPAGSYTVTVNATSTGASRSTAFTLVVQ